LKELKIPLIYTNEKEAKYKLSSISGKYNLRDKTVIITGGAGGIGKQIALGYAAEGVKIALVDVSEKDLKRVRSEIKDRFKDLEIMICCCDVSCYQEVSETVSKVYKKFGRIDFLVNNAGIVSRSLIEDLDCEEWDKIIQVNLSGVLYFSKAVIPFMKKKKSGRIINASSNMAFIPDVGMSAYSISKAGVEVLSKVLASELAPYGIRVNAYSPGIIETRMTENIRKNRGKQKLKYISCGRFGTAEEVAELVLFLSSEYSDYITGAVVPIDGGLLTTQNPWMAWG
jgi:3-oxoacyl-[acyl-carrier protein] reductase